MLLVIVVTDPTSQIVVDDLNAIEYKLVRAVNRSLIVDYVVPVKFGSRAECVRETGTGLHP